MAKSGDENILFSLIFVLDIFICTEMIRDNEPQKARNEKSTQKQQKMPILYCLPLND